MFSKLKAQKTADEKIYGCESFNKKQKRFLQAISESVNPYEVAHDHYELLHHDLR